MNLSLIPRSTSSTRRQIESLAKVYTKDGRSIRVPLRPNRIANGFNHNQSAERQFMRWFTWQSAANPGYLQWVRSILLVTPEPLCSKCRQALFRFFDRQHLADRVRLQTLNPGQTTNCNCRREQGRVLNIGGAEALHSPNTYLDVLMNESEMDEENRLKKIKRLGAVGLGVLGLAMNPSKDAMPVRDLLTANAKAENERRKIKDSVEDNTPSQRQQIPGGIPPGGIRVPIQGSKPLTLWPTANPSQYKKQEFSERLILDEIMDRLISTELNGENKTDLYHVSSGQQVDERIPTSAIENKWFASQKEAREAAVAVARSMGKGFSVKLHLNPKVGTSHFHVVNAKGRQISGHFFFGPKPRFTPKPQLKTPPHRKGKLENDGRRRGKFELEL